MLDNFFKLKNSKKGSSISPRLLSSLTRPGGQDLATGWLKLVGWRHCSTCPIMRCKECCIRDDSS